MTTPSDNIPESLIELTLEYLVPILEETLHICAERHTVGEGKGADGFSFGTDAWSLPARMFVEHAKEGSIPFDVVNEDGCALVYGQIRIRHHRVGETEHDDIAVSFPRNAKAASREAFHQFDLPFGDVPHGDPEEAGKVVLAYMANPVDGLCAVHLATVGQIRNGKIRAWDRTVEVWRRGGVPLSGAGTAPQVPAERVSAPVVRRGSKKERKYGQE